MEYNSSIGSQTLEKHIFELDKAVITHQDAPEDKFLQDAVFRRMRYSYDTVLQILCIHLRMAPESISFGGSALFRKAENAKILLPGSSAVFKEYRTIYRKARLEVSEFERRILVTQMNKIMPKFMRIVSTLIYSLRSAA